MNLLKLADKFEARDIEWRVQQSGKTRDNLWALVIPYITNRAIMQRLDDVCGPNAWKNEFIASPCGKGYQCGISIKIGDEWITRWDGAETTGNGGIDPVKSTMSNSMKRAGVQWGIGRYLYRLETTFTKAAYCDARKDCAEGWVYQYVNKKGDQAAYGMQWMIPELPTWSVPTTQADINNYLAEINKAETIEQLKKAFKYAYNLAESEQDPQLMGKFTEAKNKVKQSILKGESEKLELESNQAVKFVQDQIKLFKTLTNESVLNGQFKLSLASAGKIQDPEVQNKAIVALNKAKAETLKALQNQPKNEG
jgi:hypothetical protein